MRRSRRGGRGDERGWVGCWVGRRVVVCSGGRRVAAELHGAGFDEGASGGDTTAEMFADLGIWLANQKQYECAVLATAHSDCG